MAREWTSELAGPDRNAADAMIGMFKEFGLQGLAKNIVNMLKQGFGSDTIYMRLQETPEWKERFKANDVRRNKGMSVLSPQEYIQTERAYRQALQAAGMPKGWYDSMEDYQSFLVRDISPSEIGERAQKARQLADTIDPEQKKALSRMGLDTGAIAAYWLDHNKAMPVLQKQVDVALLNAERKRAGFAYSDSYAETLYGQGIDAQQAREGYSVIADQLPQLDRLAEVSGEDFSLNELEREVFGGDAEVTGKRRRLASEERGRFGGSSGASQGTLGRDSTFS